MWKAFLIDIVILQVIVLADFADFTDRSLNKFASSAPSARDFQFNSSADI
jgi:hypothetical protein